MSLLQFDGVEGLVIEGNGTPRGISGVTEEMTMARKRIAEERKRTPGALTAGRGLTARTGGGNLQVASGPRRKRRNTG